MKRTRRGVLAMTAFASCIENGSMLNTMYWDLTTLRVIATNIFGVIQKDSSSCFKDILRWNICF